MKYFCQTDDDAWVVSQGVNVELPYGAFELSSPLPHLDFKYVRGELIESKCPEPRYLYSRTPDGWQLDAGIAWLHIRHQRDKLIAATDWRVTVAAETGIPMDPAWSAYRQALRDITEQPDPLDITWPTPPAS